jgi:hypothetical protein
MEFPDAVEEKKTPVKAFGLEHCVLLDNTFCTPNKLLTVVHSHPRALSIGKYLTRSPISDEGRDQEVSTV